MCFLFWHVFLKCVNCVGGEVWGLGVEQLCVRSFPFSAVGVVADVKKELNNRVCLAASGWSTAACCIIIARCPSPLTSYSSNCGQREREEEEGVRGKKGRGRENE